MTSPIDKNEMLQQLGGMIDDYPQDLARVAPLEHLDAASLKVQQLAHDVHSLNTTKPELLRRMTSAACDLLLASMGAYDYTEDVP